MGIDKLANALLLDAEKDAKSIISDAKESAKKILSDADKEEKVLLDNAVKEVGLRLKSQESERISWANLEGKKIYAREREKAVKFALSELLSIISNMRKDKRYKEFMKEKLKKSISEIGSSSLIVHVRRGDKKYINSIRSSGLKIVEDLNASGGLLAVTKSGDVSVDYTLETIYDMEILELRRKIYNYLFKNKS